MQIKNVIHDNDYEFSLSSFMALSSAMTASSTISFSTFNSSKDGQQSQQQEIQKICILLFDSYYKICMQTNSDQQSVYISKQSVQGIN
jgi:hypothetical protein